ncbi:MAG: ankyrin repeat domain-containing protein [Spirochaetaceae bacterium]|jgi:ankyrin repeat protein|nr:ankyrin repeat domain-containing protein [Spirochaetaceae bacterium]
MKGFRRFFVLSPLCIVSILVLGSGTLLFAEENPDRIENPDQAENLNRGEDPDKTENPDRIGQEEKDAALLAELQEGNISRVKALLKAGADPNRPDQNGRTAAWLAVDMYSGAADLLELLADAGLRFDTLDRRGISPLFRAAGWGSSKAGALLFILNWEEKNSPGFTGGKTSRSAYLSSVLAEVCEVPRREEEAAALFAAGADLSAFVRSGEGGPFCQIFRPVRTIRSLYARVFP